MAFAEVRAVEHFVDAEHLRVFLGHPRRARAAWRGQNGIDAVLVKVFDHIAEPAEGVRPLFRFEGSPGENRQGDAVNVRLLHQLDVACQNIGPVEPLVGIVVAAVQHGVVENGCHVYLLTFALVEISGPKKVLKFSTKNNRI